MAKVICISTQNIDYSKQLVILRYFSLYGFLDVAIITKSSGVIEATNLQSINGKLIAYRNVNDGRVLFPDRLKNLNNYQYRILIFSQPPRVLINRDEINTPMMYFLELLARKQNAFIRLTVLDGPKTLVQAWNRRDMDLTLNSAITFPESKYPKLLTYEESAYCILVPLSSKYKNPQFIFLKPFDWLIWMLLILTVATIVCVWKLFGRQGVVDSHWLVGFSVTVAFIGQGAVLSNRNRVILKILFQLTILMIFVLSTIYESIITSFMIHPMEQHRLRTFNQILDSNYEIMTDAAFMDAVKDSKEFIAIKSRIKVPETYENYETEIKRQHYVYVRKCDSVEFKFDEKSKSDKKGESDFYYLLPERILKFYVRLEASFLNPFITRLQYYMDLSFEAGLPQIWTIFSEQGVLNSSNLEFSVDPKILKLKDLAQVFYILLFGCSVTTLLLLMEIFFCNVLRNLKHAHLLRQLRNKINQLAIRKRELRRTKPQQNNFFCIINKPRKVKRLVKMKANKILILVQPASLNN